MTCYSPIEAWRATKPNENGKWPLVFSLSEGDPDRPIMIPCNQCIGCRLEYSRQWAVRMMHEKQLHEDACFITLTYDDENLPYPPTVRVDHFQKFMKRLRKDVQTPLRYFHCGEYGDEGNRPHYHLALFGYEPPDRVLFSCKNQNSLYTSESLSNIWGLGFVSFGALTFDSAAYIARYVTKKVNGDLAKQIYEFEDPQTGEVFPLRPPYCSMSRRPGLGGEWFKQFSADVTRRDIVVNAEGVPQKPPGFYDRLLEHSDPRAAAATKRERKKRALANRADNTSRRLKDKETVKLAQTSNLTRSL